MKELILLFSLFSLAGCAPINTEFSCHETAQDRCLTIEEVDAMTSYYTQSK